MLEISPAGSIYLMPDNVDAVSEGSCVEVVAGLAFMGQMASMNSNVWADILARALGAEEPSFWGSVSVARISAERGLEDIDPDTVATLVRLVSVELRARDARIAKLPHRPSGAGCTPEEQIAWPPSGIRI